MLRTAKVALVIVAVCGFTLPMVAQTNRVVVGIMPVYDSTAEDYALHLAPNITYMLFQALQSLPNVQPTLLSPGGLYDPTADDWIAEFAQKSHVDAVLIATLLPSVKDGDRHRFLQFDLQLFDPSTGKRSDKALNNQVRVKALDLAFADSTHRNVWNQGKAFANQPLGKASAKLADWTQDYLRTTIPTMNLAQSGSAVLATDHCQIAFRIRYKQRNTSSKAFSVTANDKEQSSTIKDGIAQFVASSGPLALRVHVEDAPRRMPTQELYQSSTIVDCGGIDHSLALELGSAGEGLLRWEK
jgi:hypothetical protein